MKLDPDTLSVESFATGSDLATYDYAEPEEPADDEVAMKSRYCTLVGTCTTCWNTRCNCA